jgi:multidrug efflux system outer membrane protein
VEQGPWKEATPGSLIARGDWWTVFNDPVLDDLEKRARAGSPTLRAYAARVDQARAVAGIAGSFRSPEVGVGAVAGRYRASGNRPDQPNKLALNKAYESDAFRVPLVAAYEVDVWGRVRRITESATARADASVAEYQTVALTLEGEIAATYFRLRQVDEERRILTQNIVLQRRARDLVAVRKEGGLASELDLSRVETELALTQAGAEDAARRRDDLQLALGLLVGADTGSIRLAESTFMATPPAIPVGLPSELLERRPDVAAAEKGLIARNAEIGVAKTAYYPSIKLTGAVGYESYDLSKLIQPDSLIWNLAGSVFQPVFNGGRIGFDVDRATAAYEEGVALYQGQLLRAFREVEGSLAALRNLDAQAKFQAIARQQASRSVQLAEIRYRAGLVNVLEVIDAQRTALRAEREALAVTGDQFASTISLVKSLGGGWEGRIQGAPGTPVALGK